MDFLRLSLVAFVVCIFPPTEVLGALRCDDHCASGCTKYGAGHCDLYCKPRATWRLRVFDHTCQPRCGGNCLYCSSYYYCDVCWKGYQLVTNSLGQRLCKMLPPVCDVHCLNPKNCKLNDQCNGPCMTDYSLTASKTCRPDCDANCIAGGCPNQGPRHCDTGNCKQNYLLLTTAYICQQCDPNCTPASPPGCTVAGTCSSSCVTGYALNAVTGSCDPCLSTCASCTSTTGCATCGPNTVSNPPTCDACDPNCSGGCSTAGYCETGTCVTGYGPTTTTPVKCGLCDANCAGGCNTNKAGHCDGSCKAGYILDGTTNTCAACQVPNSNFCTSCTAAGTCDTCAAGHTLSSGYCS